MKLYEGIRVDKNDNVIFNWKYDDRHRDALLLDWFEARYFNENDIRYVYAYNYTDNATGKDKKIIRNYLKNPDNQNIEYVEEFVDNGILRLDAVEAIRNFDVFVCTKPRNSSSLLGTIRSYLYDYAMPLSINFELIKKCYRDVTFDKEKLERHLQELEWNKKDIKEISDRTERKFNELKKSGKLSQMKRFIPRQVRVAFSDFLKFSSEKEKVVYETLQDANVLVYDDFLTSGATVNEIIRYLKSINENNKLTVFVLINQRDV